MLWFVSILNVIRNFFATSDDFGSAYGFVTHSFTHTSLVVQAMLVWNFRSGYFFFAFDLYRSRIHSQ